jgi:hypothetical protein
MGIYQATSPRIMWGSGFTTSASFAFPIDNAQSISEQRDGSEYVVAPSGNTDAWTTGRNFLLTGNWRWIPTTNSTSPLQTGWDGTTGVRAMLEYMQDQQPVRLYPDAKGSAFITCYLSSPMGPNSVAGAVSIEADGSRNLQMTLYSSGSAFDGYGR